MAARRCEIRIGWCLIIFVIYSYHIPVIGATSIHPSSLNVFIGENAVFECYNGITEPSKKWHWFKGDYKNPETIALESSFTKRGYEFVVSNTRKVSSLTILNTTIENDQSQYYCQFGSSSKIANLTIIVGSRLDPIYPECEADITAVNTRKTVTMRCGASGGNPKPLLQWYRNGVTMEHDDFINIGDDNSYFSESTQVLTFEDEKAVFMCKAEGLATTENQTCYIDIRVPPTVMLISTTTSFNTGDSLEFSCLAMTPWNLTDYSWTVNNQLVATSNSIYNLTDDKTTLIMNNLQSGDADTEIKCEAVTSSGLFGSSTVTILLIDESNIFTIVAIVIGGLLFLTLLCLIILILIRRKRLQEKASFDKPVAFVEPSYQKYSADVIVHGVPLDNPTFINETNLDYYSYGSHLTPPVRFKLKDHNYDTKVDVHGVAENYPKKEAPSGFETYANTGSIASLGSFCSFNSFDDDHVEVQNQLYAQSQDSSLIEGKSNFGDLYEKPIDGKHNRDTQSVDGITDFGDLYAKPIKHRQSIHQSLENISGTHKLNYCRNGSPLTPPVRVKPKDHNYDTKVDVHGVSEHYHKKETTGGFETYANTGSVASLGSFCSFNSFDDDHVEDQNQLYAQSQESRSINGKSNFEDLYAKPIDRKHNPGTQSIDRIANFGDLYARPIKDKQNQDTQSVDGIADFGDPGLYGKPIKEKQNPDKRSINENADFENLYAKPIKHRQSIHQSLENILGSPKNISTSSNRSDSVDDLYSRPNKKRVTASSGRLSQLYAKPDRKDKGASEVRPITYPCGPKIENNTLSNKIEHDFTYSSIV